MCYQVPHCATRKVRMSEKDKFLTVRFSTDEYMKLQKFAKDEGISISSLVRNYIINGKTRSEDKIDLLSSKIDLALEQIEAIKEISLGAISAGASAEMSTTFKRAPEESVKEAELRFKTTINMLVKQAIDHGIALNEKFSKLFN